jgi:LysR family transcriptional regulator for metE and metH
VSFVMLTEAMLEMVKARLGVAVMQTWAIEPALHAGDVKAIPITAKGVRRQWSAATLVQDGAVPYVDAFIALLAARGMPARQRPLTSRRRSHGTQGRSR